MFQRPYQKYAIRCPQITETGTHLPQKPHTIPQWPPILNITNVGPNCPLDPSSGVEGGGGGGCCVNVEVEGL